MNYEQWHAEADRLKKCLDYSPTGSQANVFREALQDHLHTQPVSQQPTSQPAKPAKPSQPVDEGFVDAFYEIAGLVGESGARDETPADAYAKRVLPAVKRAVLDSKRLDQLENAICRYGGSTGAILKYTPGSTGYSFEAQFVEYNKASSLRQLIDRIGGGL